MVFKCSVSDLWIVEPAILCVGNKFHPCAVLVPLDDDVGKEILKHAVDMGVAIAGFCKTANIGIEKVICNVLANPNIRWIVVAGNENPGHRSGKAIIMLHRYGVDPKTRRIKCGEDTICRDIPTGYIPNIPLEAIERFRRQVKIIDILIDGREVTEENVLELTCLAVYGTIQEPKNMYKIKIKNVEYKLFDPGAFDTKPYKITITEKCEKPIEILGIDHAHIRIFDKEEIEKELKKIIKYGIHRNIVIIYGKYVEKDVKIREKIIQNNNMIAYVEEFEKHVDIRGVVIRPLKINDIKKIIDNLEEEYKGKDVHIILTISKISNNAK